MPELSDGVVTAAEIPHPSTTHDFDNAHDASNVHDAGQERAVLGPGTPAPATPAPATPAPATPGPATPAPATPGPAPPAPAPPAPARRVDRGPELHPGLAGVYLSTTRTSRVDGEAGELTVAGFELEELAPRATFEEVVWLLLTGELPSSAELRDLRAFLASQRPLPDLVLEALCRAAERRLPPMAALRAAVACFELGGPSTSSTADAASCLEAPAGWADDPQGFLSGLAILARIPTAVAAYERLVSGKDPGEPGLEPSSSIAEAFLAQLHGREPRAEEVRALDTYLNTVADHGCNASTFAARVVVSTGADLLAAILGALGALSGPLHGGAPGPALDLIFEIGSPDRAEEVLRARLEAGERLMGFGHRVYKVRDPRAAVLATASEDLFAGRGEARESTAGEPDDLYGLFRHVEATATRLLDEHKPGRRLRANVELYTALLLHGLGLRPEAFTSIFTMARTAGWLAHAREQTTGGRLIRPRLLYEGERGRKYSSPG